VPVVSSSGYCFDPDSDSHATAAVDETKVSVEDGGVYVRVATDVDTFEVAHMEVFPGAPALIRCCFRRPEVSGMNLGYQERLDLPPKNEQQTAKEETAYRCQTRNEQEAGKIRRLEG